MAALCECGCGRETSIAKYSDPRYGYVKGEPVRYIRGHHFRRDPEARFRAKINVVTDPNECWLWTATLNSDGYGQFWTGEAVVKAHRWAYEHWIGPIPEGRELDHLCRVASCVNPAHLQPVTHHENVLRGNAPAARQARQTHCKRGHVLAGDNLLVDARGHRRCRACDRLRRAAA